MPSCLQRKLEQCEEMKKKCNELAMKKCEATSDEQLKDDTQAEIKKLDIQVAHTSKKPSKLSFLRIKKKPSESSTSKSSFQSIPDLPSLTSLDSLSSESPITSSSKKKKKKILVQCKEKVQSLLVKS